MVSKGPKILHPPYFATLGERLVDNGYRIVALLPQQKRPRYQNWQAACFKPPTPTWLDWQAKRHPDDGIGMACGEVVVGIDIDLNDAAKAFALQELAINELGDTPLIRVGRWPRRLLVYAAGERVDTIRLGSLEILGCGSQFVAFGIHPELRQPYYWIDETPADRDRADIPLVRWSDLKRFIERACALIGRDARAIEQHQPANDNKPRRIPGSSKKFAKLRALVTRNEAGIVIDGREAYLTILVWEEYQNGYGTPETLADAAWARFVATADLIRPKARNPRTRWSFKDALSKARYIFRKQPGKRRPTWQRRRHPAGHLHSFRRPEYWTSERKIMHQQEAARRALAPSVLIVNKAMLDETSLDAGQCTVSIRAIVSQTTLSRSAVTTARHELLSLGLWIAERGVYVPILPDQAAQADDFHAERSFEVQAGAGSLSRSVGSPLVSLIEPEPPESSQPRRCPTALHSPKAKAA